MEKNVTPRKGIGTRKFGGKLFYYIGRTLYPSKAKVAVLQLAEKGITARTTMRSDLGTLVWADSNKVWLDFSEPIYNPIDISEYDKMEKEASNFYHSGDKQASLAVRGMMSSFDVKGLTFNPEPKGTKTVGYGTTTIDVRPGETVKQAKKRLEELWKKNNPGRDYHIVNRNRYMELAQKQTGVRKRILSEIARSEDVNAILSNPAKGDKSTLQCQFCEKIFKRTIGPRTVDIKCPKCGEYDVEVIGNPGTMWHEGQIRQLRAVRKDRQKQGLDTRDQDIAISEHQLSWSESKRRRIDNPARSIAQQQLFGIAYDIKTGRRPKSYSPEAAKIASRMTKRQLVEFAGTKHAGLPGHVNPTDMKMALAMRERYRDDLKAGHSAAEYWRGQAGAYFTGNPRYGKLTPDHRRLFETSDYKHALDVLQYLKQTGFDDAIMKRKKTSGKNVYEIYMKMYPNPKDGGLAKSSPCIYCGEPAGFVGASIIRTPDGKIGRLHNRCYGKYFKLSNPSQYSATKFKAISNETGKVRFLVWRLKSPAGYDFYDLISKTTDGKAHTKRLVYRAESQMKEEIENKLNVKLVRYKKEKNPIFETIGGSVLGGTGFATGFKIVDWATKKLSKK